MVGRVNFCVICIMRLKMFCSMVKCWVVFCIRCIGWKRWKRFCGCDLMDGWSLILKWCWVVMLIVIGYFLIWIFILDMLMFFVREWRWGKMWWWFMFWICFSWLLSWWLLLMIGWVCFWDLWVFCLWMGWLLKMLKFLLLRIIKFLMCFIFRIFKINYLMMNCVFCVW